MACQELGLASAGLEWLEELRLPDELSAAAYEATSQDLRARLKGGMAYAQRVFGQAEGGVERHLLEAGHSAISRESLVRPVDWVMLYIAEDYAAAARVLACAILPRLCAVRDVFAVFAGPEPEQAALVSLELCGVQDLYCLGPEELKACLAGLAGSGRLLNLGNSLPDSLASHPMLCLNETTKPKILTLDPEAFAPDLLCFMHGFCPECAQNTKDLSASRALFVSQARADGLLKAGGCADCLLLTPGSEGCWRFPGLSRQSFSNETERISLSMP
ncbi:MAG: histidinol dehydrogenase [Desulfovibrio sp.]|nr:histidinol dehydrogenase [Desulfovibrio sp.]